MWLVDWLIDRWTAVWDWFGTAYWSTRLFIWSIPNKLDNLLATIYSYYQAAINTISGYVYDFYQDWIVPKLNWLHGRVLEAIDKAITAYELAITITDTIYDQIQQVYNNAVDYIVAKYDDVINDLKQSVDNVIDNYLPDIITKINAFVAVLNGIKEIVTKLPILSIQQLVDLYNKYKATLTMFLDNPIGFILGVIEKEFLLYLSFLLAYALGSTKYSLPTAPIWGRKR